MTWFVEDPWPVLLATLAILALLGVALFRTGQARIIGAMVAVALLGGAGLLIEWLVVTEREEVEAALFGAAEALKRNDLDAVLSHIAPEAAGMRASVTAILPGIEVSEVKLANLKITLNRLTNPPSARAEFVGRVTVKSRQPGLAFPYDNFVRPFVVRLRRENDRWVMTEYEMGDMVNPTIPPDR
jgi:hypothetical protein